VTTLPKRTPPPPPRRPTNKKNPEVTARSVRRYLEAALGPEQSSQTVSECWSYRHSSGTIPHSFCTVTSTIKEYRNGAREQKNKIGEMRRSGGGNYQCDAVKSGISANVSNEMSSTHKQVRASHVPGNRLNIIIFSGSAAKRGLWPPRSQGFLITHNDAPQSVVSGRGISSSQRPLPD
jgi:hypothetical protein